MTLYETIQRIVHEELGRVRTAELAVVQEQHPHASNSDKDNYACTVRLRNTGIVLRHVPVATQRIGGVSIPDVGELVLVQFIGGDVNAPIITGCLYNDEDRPPVNEHGQAVLHLPLDAGDSDAVHIELHSDEKREMVIRLGSGVEISVRDEDPVLEIKADGNRAKVRIDRDGAISLKSQGKVRIEGAEVAVEAQGTLDLKGKTVNIN